MRIAVDVMGGDHGSGVVVDGVCQALADLPLLERLCLVGREEEIRAALTRRGETDPRLEVVHASEVLTMEDKPVQGLRRKKDCSILRAVDLVKQGQAQAVISPGNTGGVVAASTLRLRPLAGLDRPGIATVIPTPNKEFVLVDAGANIDSRPLHLAHYAVMGHIYARDILKVANPRVGLLSVGTEEIKGNDLTQEAFKVCRRLDLNFIGNVEGHDLFADRVDVVVCDGFVGNVVLKTCESMASEIFAWIRRELKRHPWRLLGAMLAKGAFKTIRERLDPETYGGAPLLGLNGMVMIAHGGSSERAIRNAVRVTVQTLQHHLPEVMSEAVQAANQRIKEQAKPSEAVSLTA